MNETRPAKNSNPYIIVEQFRAYFLFGNGLISQDFFVNIFANFVVYLSLCFVATAGLHSVGPFKMLPTFDHLVD